MKVEDLDVGGVITVFPEGHVGVADSQTLLIRVSNEAVTTREGRETLGAGGLRRVLEGLHARRLPGRPVPAGHPAPALPVPPVDVRRARRRPPRVRPGHPLAAAAAAHGRRRRSAARAGRLRRARRARLLEPRHLMLTRTARDLARQAARRGALRADRAQQGVPRPLVVHDRRDRHVRPGDPDPDRRLPHVLLRPRLPPGRVRRQLRAAARACTCRPRTSRPCDVSLRRARRPRDAPDPPLGGAAVRRRDPRAPAAHLLHRRVPPAARDQLGDRPAACCCSASPTGSPATASPTTCSPAPGCASPTRCCSRSRSLGPWLAFLVFGGEFPSDDIISRLFVIHVLIVPALIVGLLTAAPRDARAAEAHAVRRARAGPNATSSARSSGRRSRRRPSGCSSSCSRCAPRSAGWRRSTRSGSTARSTRRR